VTLFTLETDTMGRMKDLLITIHNGGDEAVAAVERMGKEWQEMLDQAASEIETLQSENNRLRGWCGLAPKQPIPDMAKK